MQVDIGRGRRVLECLLDVSVLEVGVLLADLLEGPAGGDQTDHGLNRDPQPADASPSLELVGLDGDAAERHRFLPDRRRLVVRPGCCGHVTVLRCSQPRANYHNRYLRSPAHPPSISARRSSARPADRPAGGQQHLHHLPHVPGSLFAGHQPAPGGCARRNEGAVGSAPITSTTTAPRSPGCEALAVAARSSGVVPVQVRHPGRVETGVQGPPEVVQPFDRLVVVWLPGSPASGGPVSGRAAVRPSGGRLAANDACPRRARSTFRNPRGPCGGVGRASSRRGSCRGARRGGPTGASVDRVPRAPHVAGAADGRRAVGLAYRNHSR